MATAELETPVATEATTQESVATPENFAATESAPAADAPSRQRDESGRFKQKSVDDSIMEKYREKRAQAEGAAAAPVAEKPAKPIAKAAPAPAPTAEDAVISKAEAAGITAYEARKLGDKLDAEIARRAEQRNTPEAAHANTQPTTATPPANTTQQPAQPAANTNPLAELEDLPAEYGEEMVQRDKALRNALQQALDANGKLQESVESRLGQLQEHFRQDEEAREREASRARSIEFDTAISELGSEFHPALGRGTIDDIAGSPYESVRVGIYQAARQLSQIFPDRDFKSLSQGVAKVLFQDLYEAGVEKSVLDRARSSAARVSKPGGSNGEPVPTGAKSLEDTKAVRGGLQRWRAARNGG